jgi:propanol-preferring alcohol dehydrogenase
VAACGVCRTDLHLAQGDLPPRRPRTVPGHEIVGIIDALGPGSQRFALGDRIGIAWLRSTDGRCRWCRRGQENLCPNARFTGWDANGGFAEFAVVPEAYAYRLPEKLDDAVAAPLLCAGIVGYRALRRAALPPGGRLGIYGFGASAHLVIQVAVHEGATVHVVTRSPAAQKLALSLGAASAGDTYDQPPELLDSAVIFAPAGEVVPVAMRALDRGGVLAFEPHTVTHPNLLDLDDARAEREIAESKRELEQRLGRGVTAFCYPGGLFGERERSLVARAGFALAVSCEPGVNDASTDPFALRRRQIDRRDSLLDFKAKVGGGHDAPLPLRDVYRRSRFGARETPAAASSRR